jgi:hypothetical protein
VNTSSDPCLYQAQNKQCLLAGGWNLKLPQSLLVHLNFRGILQATLSSALSIILFVSVIPVLYASETLPEGKVHARKLNKYLRKMGKRVEENKKPDSSSL